MNAKVAQDIKAACLEVPPHRGLIWFLSRDTLREIVRGQRCNTLTLDFHFPDVKQQEAIQLFYEIADLINYHLDADYDIIRIRECGSFLITHHKTTVAEIKLLVLISGRKLQYLDTGSWISILPHWCMSLDNTQWLGIRWPIPNTVTSFVKSIYRRS